MNKPVESNVNKAVDSIQENLTNYACALSYDAVSPEAIHAAKVRIIDTLGALMGGFFAEPSFIARNLAAKMPHSEGATVIGTRMKTTPEMAAFVNATTARYPELTDTYHWPGSYRGHPSDVLLPVFAAAEHAHANGSEFITAVVLAYEVYCRVADVFHNTGFDITNLSCIGTAVAAGKLLGLSPEQLSHCISMAVVPNVTLRQVRTGHLSMWKVVAAGHAGRAGVFAAMLARAGMEGPHLPFEGKAGWCDHVARERFTLNMGSDGGKRAPFRILDTIIKNRPAMGIAICAILAAEKVAPLRSMDDVKQITVEIYKRAVDFGGTGEHCWNPDTKETADHSIPYLVAATLMDGTITLRSYNDAHLWNPALRALMQTIKVVENNEFTRASESPAAEHRARVTILNNNGEKLVGESGGDQDDLSTPKSDQVIIEKFRGLTEDCLGVKRVNTILDRLWHLDEMKDVATIPPDFVLT